MKFEKKKNTAYNLINTGVEHLTHEIQDTGDSNEVIQHAQEENDNVKGVDDHNKNFNSNDIEGSEIGENSADGNIKNMNGKDDKDIHNEEIAEIDESNADDNPSDDEVGGI